MERFILLHAIMWQMVNKLRLANATPIRSHEDSLRRKAHMIMIVEESLTELDKYGLFQEGSIGPALDSLKKIKETLLSDKG